MLNPPIVSASVIVASPTAGSLNVLELIVFIFTVAPVARDLGTDAKQKYASAYI